MDYAKAIRVIRSARGLSKKELADSLGVGASYLSMLEGGARQPGREVLEALAKVLGVPMYMFLYLASEDGDHHGLPRTEAEEFGKRALQVLLHSRGKHE